MSYPESRRHTPPGLIYNKFKCLYEVYIIRFPKYYISHILKIIGIFSSEVFKIAAKMDFSIQNLTQRGQAPGTRSQRRSWAKAGPLPLIWYSVFCGPHQDPRGLVLPSRITDVETEGCSTQPLGEAMGLLSLEPQAELFICQ